MLLSWVDLKHFVYEFFVTYMVYKSFFWSIDCPSEFLALSYKFLNLNLSSGHNQPIHVAKWRTFHKFGLQRGFLVRKIHCGFLWIFFFFFDKTDWFIEDLDTSVLTLVIEFLLLSNTVCPTVLR